MDSHCIVWEEKIREKCRRKSWRKERRKLPTIKWRKPCLGGEMKNSFLMFHNNFKNDERRKIADLIAHDCHGKRQGLNMD